MTISPSQRNDRRTGTLQKVPAFRPKNRGRAFARPADLYSASINKSHSRESRPKLMSVALIVALLRFLAYALAVYPRLFMRGMTAARFFYQTGSGIIGAGLGGIAAAVAALNILAFVFETMRRPVLRVVVAIVFDVLAAVAGYALMHGPRDPCHPKSGGKSPASSTVHRRLIGANANGGRHVLASPNARELNARMGGFWKSFLCSVPVCRQGDDFRFPVFRKMGGATESRSSRINDFRID